MTFYKNNYLWKILLVLSISFGFSQTKSTVVIFKFENLADDEKTNWLGSGISETLISEQMKKQSYDGLLRKPRMNPV